MPRNRPVPANHPDSGNPCLERRRQEPYAKGSGMDALVSQPPMHLGWGLRLNGPVDNTLSSCQSCHATAQFPQITPILATMASNADGKNLTPKDPEWMRWFRNVPCATPFDEQATSMDYSLQLAASVQNFLAAKAAATGGLYNVQYWNGAPVKQIYGQRGTQAEKQ